MSETLGGEMKKYLTLTMLILLLFAYSDVLAASKGKRNVEWQLSGIPGGTKVIRLDGSVITSKNKENLLNQRDYNISGTVYRRYSNKAKLVQFMERRKHQRIIYSGISITKNNYTGHWYHSDGTFGAFSLDYLEDAAK